MTSPRLSLIRIVAVALVLAGVGLVAFRLFEPTRVIAYRKQAEWHHKQVQIWAHYADPARLRVSKLEPGPMANGHQGFHHMINRDYAWTRPTNNPKEEAVYDAEWARDVAVYGEMQKYHQKLEAKWNDAAKRRLAGDEVDPDPPPPHEFDTPPV